MAKGTRIKFLGNENEELFSDKEEDGELETRRAGFDVFSGGNVVARCRMGIEVERGKNATLAWSIVPTQDIGIELSSQGEYRGPVAIAFAKLVAAASRHLADGSRNSDFDFGNKRSQDDDDQDDIFNNDIPF